MPEKRRETHAQTPQIPDSAPRTHPINPVSAIFIRNPQNRREAPSGSQSPSMDPFSMNDAFERHEQNNKKIRRAKKSAERTR
ncbi:hypothetical protein GCM10027440_54970 [Nocardiopsis coralliicola]